MHLIWQFVSDSPSPYTSIPRRLFERNPQLARNLTKADSIKRVRPHWMKPGIVAIHNFAQPRNISALDKNIIANTTGVWIDEFNDERFQVALRLFSRIIHSLNLKVQRRWLELSTTGVAPMMESSEHRDTEGMYL